MHKWNAWCLVKQASKDSRTLETEKGVEQQFYIHLTEKKDLEKVAKEFFGDNFIKFTFAENLDTGETYEYD